MKGIYVNIVKFNIDEGYYDYVKGIAIDSNGNYYRLLNDCAYFCGRSYRDNRFIDISFNASDCDNIFGKCYGDDEGACIFLYTKVGEYENGGYIKIEDDTDNVEFIGVCDNSLYQVDKYGIIKNAIYFYSQEEVYLDKNKMAVPECLHIGVGKNYRRLVESTGDIKFYNNKDLVENNITLKIDNCYYDYEEYTLEINILAVDHFKIKVYKGDRLYREIDIKDANYTNIARLIEQGMSTNIRRTSKLDLF